MNVIAKAGSAGAAGALTTNLLHEVVRRSIPDAPRVDLLGMQALSGGLNALGMESPKGRALYNATLASDLISNTAYFACAATGKNAVLTGMLLGVLAGVGAVVLPEPMQLDPGTTSRTPATALLSVLLYTAGGIAAGITYSLMKDA
jgi:hypothetical protein